MKRLHTWMGDGVTTPVGVVAHVATGIEVGEGAFAIDKVVGVGVSTEVGLIILDVVIEGSVGGVPVHSTQYSLPTSRAEQMAPGL